VSSSRENTAIKKGITLYKKGFLAVQIGLAVMFLFKLVKNPVMAVKAKFSETMLSNSVCFITVVYMFLTVGCFGAARARS
jgi:hypothetical protein